MRNISAKLDVVSNYEITFSLIAGTLFVCHRGQFLLSLVALIVSWSIGTLLNINNELILSVYRHFLFLLTELAMAPGALVLMIFAGKYDRKEEAGARWCQMGQWYSYFMGMAPTMDTMGTRALYRSRCTIGQRNKCNNRKL